jgi:hypothetical protein
MRRPYKGDRVRIIGQTGLFQVVNVTKDGLFADLRRLQMPGPDYIEKEIPRVDLIYVNATRAPIQQARALDNGIRLRA